MIPFDMVEPTSLTEAVSMLDPQEPTIRAVAGGTALMLMMKAGVFAPSRLICLHGIEPQYAKISVTDDGAVRVGAMATLSDLEHDRNVAARLPVLVHALRRLSNPRVRNVARVGGALAHGDPHMDLPPVLMALGARVSIVGPRGARDLPLEALYAGYYETVLEKNELIAAAAVPASERTQIGLYEGNVPLGRRLAGARRGRVVYAGRRSHARSDPCRQRRDGEGHPLGERRESAARRRA